MDDPTVVMIGAGAMGGTMAGALLSAGVRLSIIDTDARHVAVIGENGLAVTNLGDGTALPVPITTEADAEGIADLVVIMTPAYETAHAALTAARVLKPDGAAVSLQNGLGNYEALCEVLGSGRVFMGSTRASADRPAPGCPRVTKMDPTVVGEIDGTDSARTRWLAEALTRGGMPAGVTSGIVGQLWSKFIHNCVINAPSAITGLRMGEVTRVPGLGALRWEILDEALAVARAKGIALADPDPREKIAIHVWRKFTRPSMQQHIDDGRPIEIEAINGWLVREAEALGVPVPINRALTMLARGRAVAVDRARAAPDYATLTAEAEAEIDRGDRPWE